MEPVTGKNMQTVKNEPAGQNTKPQSNALTVTEEELAAFDRQIEKAEGVMEAEDVIEVLKSIRKALSEYEAGGGADDV